MESGKDYLHSKLFEVRAQICDMSRQISAKEASYHNQICDGQIEARKKLRDMKKKMKILDLVLMHKWYDMIERGEKWVEYRKPILHCIKRLLLIYDTSAQAYIDIDNIMAQAIADNPKSIHGGLEKGYLKFKDYDAVRFRRGYTKTSMLLIIDKIHFGYGLSGLGAPRYEEVFNIELGKRL